MGRLAMKLPVYAYDDLPANISSLAEASQALIADLSLVANRVHTEEAWLNAYNQIKGLNGDFVLLLDLGYRNTAVPLWGAVKKAFESALTDKSDEYQFTDDNQLKFSINKEDKSFATLPNGVLDGLGLLLASLHNTNPGRTLIYVASGRGNLGSLKAFISKISSYFSCYNTVRKIVVSRDVDGENVEDERSAKAILEKLIRKWHKTYPDFHPEVMINNCIEKWIGYYRILNNSVNEKVFCDHNHIENNAEAYSRLAHDIFGTGADEFENDKNGLKALFQLCHAKNPNHIDDRKWMNGWFEPWDRAEPDRRIKPMSSSCFSLIIKSVFEIRKVTVEEGEYGFPLRPALPFIFSMRQLAQAMQEQDGGILDSGKAILLKGIKGGFRLSIPLKQNPDQYFGLAKRWVEKIQAGGNEIGNNGVCAALWKTLLARVDGVDAANASDDEKKLLTLFNGPGRPVCGVTFAPHYIHLHWS